MELFVLPNENYAYVYLQIMAMTAGGIDTVSHLLPFLLYSLAKNPEIQEKVRDEADHILSGKRSKSIDFADLPLLEYTGYCIKESLRVYPPFPNIPRCTNAPLEIDGKWIPSGVNVNIHIWLTHHNPEIWTNPFQFDPSRFSPENSKDRDPYAFIPFGAGPRQCIANQFTMTEAKIFTARVLHEFEISIDPNYELQYDISVTNILRGKLPLRFQSRVH